MGGEMTRRKLTDIGIRTLKATAEYRELVDVSGLRVGIQPLPSSTKTFLTRYRRPISKASAKLVHGRFPELSLSAARVAHAQALAAVAAGTDPGAAKRAARVSVQEAEAARRGDTIEVHVKAHLERQRLVVSHGHWRQARLALQVDAVAAWCGRPVSEIARRDVRELAEQIAKTRGPMAGNRAFEHVRKFFNELVEREIVASSPCAGLRRPTAKEVARERVLNEAEIRSLMAALDAIRGPTAAAIKLMLLTGQRRSEVAGMRWSEIDDGDTWRLPGARTKNGRPHDVPLSRQVLAVIEQQPRTPGCDFVFTTSSKPVANFTHIKKQIDAIMKSEPWVIHDLRRTCASGMAGLGIALPVIEKCLNHASGSFRGIVGVYQRHDFQGEKRTAQQRWGDHIACIVVRGETAKVLPLRKKGAFDATLP
jgi:integrase